MDTFFLFPIGDFDVDCRTTDGTIFLLSLTYERPTEVSDEPMVVDDDTDVSLDGSVCDLGLIERTFARPLSALSVGLGLPLVLPLW